MTAEGTTELPMMKCGHRAQGHNGYGEPVCVVCFGLFPGAKEVMPDDEVKERIEGRMMRCSYRSTSTGKPCENHANPRPSDPRAAFFSSDPDADFDTYYCGCWGWD